MVASCLAGGTIRLSDMTIARPDAQWQRCSDVMSGRMSRIISMERIEQMSDPAPLLVVYDRGAASPGELGPALAGLGPLVFAVPDTEHVRLVRPVLAELGRVVDLSGDEATDVARVASLRPRGVVTYAEQMLRCAAAFTESLGLPGHSRPTADRLTDKHQQRERQRAAGADNVRSRLIAEPGQWTDALGQVGFPAVVKPARGQASRSTYPVLGPADADQVHSRIFGPAAAGGDRWVVEEMLVGRPELPHGDYVSVESLSGPWGTRPIAVTGKHPLRRPFRETGHFWPSHLSAPEQAQLIALATATVTALGVTTGITQTEIKLTPNGPHVIEVNGRLGGHIAELARRSCGVDLIRLAALSALGLAEPPALLRPDRVYFQYNVPAPVGSAVFLGVHGAADVRRIPGITGYRPYVRPGDRLDHGVMTYQLDLLCGDTASHPEMAHAIEAALERLEFEYLDDIGRRHRSRMVMVDE